MKTSLKIVHTRDISLDENEQFRFKPPRSWRTWHIGLIEVCGRHFFLYGGVRRGALLRVQHGFSSFDEVPTMPHAVRLEVERCMNAFGDESYVTHEREL